MNGPAATTEELDLLRRVLTEATVWAEGGAGGPFAAGLLMDGELVALARNQVVATHDPTAHAEITALRVAARRLGTHDLSGAALVASCEPCPMCIAAAWWARVSRVVFSGVRADAAAAGFDDVVLYEELAAPLDARRLPMIRALADDGTRPFEAWAQCPTRVPY